MGKWAARLSKFELFSSSSKLRPRVASRREDCLSVVAPLHVTYRNILVLCRTSPTSFAKQATPGGDEHPFRLQVTPTLMLSFVSQAGAPCKGMWASCMSLMSQVLHHSQPTCFVLCALCSVLCAPKEKAELILRWIDLSTRVSPHTSQPPFLPGRRADGRGGPVPVRRH
ncbi:hypothetical protein LY76DRAFT_196119 [Colletotrichum caudatum]|nr:hypothetical protein LY76DRAFT_196119 [Colletotrichum caudatum]